MSGNVCIYKHLLDANNVFKVFKFELVCLSINPALTHQCYHIRRSSVMQKGFPTVVWKQTGRFSSSCRHAYVDTSLSAESYVNVDAILDVAKMKQ